VPFPFRRSFSVLRTWKGFDRCVCVSACLLLTTGVPSLKRSELELACEDFSNVIGSLSDYMVYKGTLSSGVEIAVVSTTKTSAKGWSKHCEKQFRKKVINRFYLSVVVHESFLSG
jgi:hypothetical protein